MENSGIYGILAPVYDDLNGQVNYGEIADFYQRELRKWEMTPTSLVLDLGCGTGKLTVEMSKRGYDMTGVDGSPEMLTVARDRAEGLGLSEKILFLCQDMTDFELYGTVEAVVSTMDCMNHLLTRKELEACFSLVHNYLSPNGLFLFDLNSPYKFRQVYGERSYLFEDKNNYCTWQNAFREGSGICDFYISLFQREKDGRYRRTDACQREKMYPLATVRTLLKKTGFQILSVYGGLDGHPVTDTDERIYITARAIS